MADAGIPDEAIRTALRAGFDLARELAAEPDQGDAGGIDIPASLKRVLGFARVPDTVLAVTRRALEADEAFRRAVAERLGYPGPVEGGGAGDTFDLAAWLWLVRPPGWSEALHELTQARSDRDRIEEIEADLTRARDDLARATARSEEADKRADLAESQAADRAGELAGERKARHDTEAELGRARSRMRELEAERDRQAGQLADLGARLTAQERVTDELRGGLDQVTRRAETVADAMRLLDEAGAAAAAFSEAVAAARRDLRRLDEPGPLPVRPRRRRSVDVPAGLDADDPEAIRAVLGHPGIHVLVDGYNVTLRRWSQLRLSEQRQRITSLVEVAAGRFGFAPVIVFDGTDDHPGVTVRTAGRVRIEFTPAETEADERIVELCEDLDPAPVVVVTSDQEVRDRVLALGANLIHADPFVEAVTPSE